MEPVLKGNRAAAAGLRGAHTGQWVPTGTKRWEPPETSGKTLYGELGHKMPRFHRSCPFIFTTVSRMREVRASAVPLLLHLSRATGRWPSHRANCRAMLYATQRAFISLCATQASQPFETSWANVIIPILSNLHKSIYV